MLRKYEQIANNAYAGISFSPEKRGEAIIRDYSQELQEDLAALENKGNYQEKYERLFLKWLVAQGRCLSFMITGAANFPVARNEKNNRYANNAYNNFRKWREGYFKAVNRVRTLSPEEEIDQTLEKLDKLLIHHEMLKGVNKIFAKKSTLEEKHQAILEGFGQSALDLVIEENEIHERVYGVKFAGFSRHELTNNNAKIKNAQIKLNNMKIRIARKESWQPIVFEGGVIDIQADRVIIKHDGRPQQDIINALKSRGFRWSRQTASWCRKHTGQAISDAKRVCGVV